ncbi:hypothetical protein Q7P37_009081 [Cladosporium fusiforme]
MAADLTRATLVRNPEYERNGMKSYVRALQKYNISPTLEGPYRLSREVKQLGSQANLQGHVDSPQLVKKDADSGHVGEVPAEDVEHNALYIAECAIGTPPQKVRLNFDTVFDPSKSSTWEDTTGTWKITYGDESEAKGVVGTDLLAMGGLTIQNQTIELATYVIATPIENMILQEDTPETAELFTAWLGNKSEHSFFTFGYIDWNSLEGQSPTYTPVQTDDGFWAFDSILASINDGYYDRSGNKAMADTGTTLCLVGDSFCEQIYSEIPGAFYNTVQQGWVFPTTPDLSTLPKVAISVGDKLFQIKPGDFAFQDLGDGTTYGGIQSRGNHEFDVLGCVFLRCVYAIFDQGNARFGCTQRGLPQALQPSPASPTKLTEIKPMPTNTFAPKKRR